MGPLASRTFAVTGATSGIGREIARGLALTGAQVLLLCRQLRRGQEAARWIGEEVPGARAQAIPCDLSDGASIERAAEEIRRRHKTLHLLVNNAGVWKGRLSLTAAGLEECFAVNHLGHFRLSNALLPLLRAAAPSRVVVVASDAHYFGDLDLEDLSWDRRTYLGPRAYAASKLANVLFGNELARRVAPWGVTVNCVHPGTVATSASRDFRLWGRWIERGLRPLAISPRRGADTPIYLGLSPEVRGLTGMYWVRRARRRSAPITYDPAAARRLWDLSEALCATVS